jgi:bifunctional non-homologous end joining protein LigD
VPIAWDELTPALAPDQFNVGNVPERLAGLKRDPWAGFAKVRQKLPKFSGTR